MWERNKREMRESRLKRAFLKRNYSTLTSIESSSRSILWKEQIKMLLLVMEACRYRTATIFVISFLRKRTIYRIYSI